MTRRAGKAPDAGAVATAGAAPGPAPAPQTRQPVPPAGSRRVSAPELSLSLQFADATDRALVTRARVRRWLRAALERPAQITVRIVGAAEGRDLNRDFRGKDYATNVLTFDYAREPAVTADLVLCAPVLQAEAAELGRPLEAHYAHLIVHGALHAQGYDHEADADAALMESRETAVMLGLGFADPYSG